MNADLEWYKIPTSLDIPEIVVRFTDRPDRRANNLGAKGLGEPPIIPTAAAVANAVCERHRRPAASRADDTRARPRSAGGGAMSLFSYAKPRALGEALKLLKNGTVALAGGTDLVGLIRSGLAKPNALVDLTGIEGLRGWTREKGKASASGRSRRSRISRHRRSCERSRRSSPESLRDAATLQLRNMGTVGGNLLQRNRCWYFRDEAVPCWLKGGTRCFAAEGENRYHAILGAAECVMVAPSDLAPALIAYDAEIDLASSIGRRSVKLGQFYVTPSGKQRKEHAIRKGELITSVRIPESALERRGTFLKAMDRKAWSFALVSVAAAARIKDGKAHDVRVVLGGVAPSPWVVPAAHKLLEGSALDDNSCLAAADLILANASRSATTATR
jgi:xanthine dehydrogenase YagS FAD-binding subunit